MPRKMRLSEQHLHEQSTKSGSWSDGLLRCKCQLKVID